MYNLTLSFSNFLEFICDLFFLAADCDYMIALRMVKSARRMLRRIRYLERYSGIRRSVIASLLGSSVSQRSATAMLKVFDYFCN